MPGINPQWHTKIRQKCQNQQDGSAKTVEATSVA